MDRQAFQERFGLLGNAPAFLRVVERIRQVAPVDITVLLEGESGVGKELLASAIHGLSQRKHKRMVVVNCGAIPEGLIESELFGAEKGAYTGAVERRSGYFEEADNGTLLLDEIGELPLPAQVRLLRVLETGTFSRVGSSVEQQTDVRIIAATNKNLAEEVRTGRFREDLYYRLSAVVIRVPSLSQRRDDILPLFEHYLYRFAQQYEAPKPALAADSRDLLQRYNWPGNVRELRNVAEQTVVFGQGRTVTAAEIRPYLRGVSAGSGLTLASKEAAGGSDHRERELIYRALLDLRMEMRELKGLLHHMSQGDGIPSHAIHPADPLPTPTFREDSFADALVDDLSGNFEFEPDEAEAHYEDIADNGFNVGEPEQAHVAGLLPPPPEEDRSSLEWALQEGLTLPTMEEAERALIKEALNRFEGNRRRTADALGISERTLYRKIKDYEDEESDG
ncbi:MAG: sigma-54 dependent transcriptional regulator [Rubricoccaceae bacterium]|nr:sigma-54 dependent transcriptional regulator [Rubricoccaceae bacterium]